MPWTRPKQPYREVTEEELIEYAVLKAQSNNSGARAVELIAETHGSKPYKAPSARAYALDKRLKNDVNIQEKIRLKLQNKSYKAIRTLDKMMDSDMDTVALNASIYVIDQTIGKPIQTNRNLNVNQNIQSVLSDTPLDEPLD